jgi:hypothetical protein
MPGCAQPAGLTPHRLSPVPLRGNQKRRQAAALQNPSSVGWEIRSYDAHLRRVSKAPLELYAFACRLW